MGEVRSGRRSSSLDESNLRNWRRRERNRKKVHLLLTPV